MAGALPRYEATNLGVFDLCHFALLRGAVQIQVGLELPDSKTNLGRTPMGWYSPRWRSRHFLENDFSEPLLRTLLRTLFYCKTHRKRPLLIRTLLRTPPPLPLPRTFSEPFLDRCVAVRPLRRAPNPRGQICQKLRYGNHSNPL